MQNRNPSTESQTPFISYILPVHNAWPYLKHAVESVLRMESNDFELIISNNHSTDYSNDYLQQLVDPRVRLVSPPMILKMNANFEFALSHARGEWIQLFGGDDAILPWHHEAIKKISAQFPDIRVVNWNRAYFYWGEAQALNNNLVVSIEISSRFRILDSASRARQALRGTISLFELPQVYTTSAVKLSLISQASKKTKNTFFVSMQPDVFSSIQILFNVKEYLRIEYPLTLVGTSPRSTGASALGNFYSKDSNLFGQEGDCKSTLNQRTSLPLMGYKNSSYFLIDSLFDYSESSGTEDERNLLKMGFANFLGSSYFPSNKELNHEIWVNLQENISKSSFVRLRVYLLSLVYFFFNPIVIFVNRARNFVFKKFIAPLDYKKVSSNPAEFESIIDLIDQIPQNRISFLN